MMRSRGCWEDPGEIKGVFIQKMLRTKDLIGLRIERAAAALPLKYPTLQWQTRVADGNYPEHATTSETKKNATVRVGNERIKYKHANSLLFKKQTPRTFNCLM